MSKGDIPEDELAELDPAAYDRLLARKALKQAEAEQDEFETRKLKAETEQRKRDEAARREEMLVRAERWDQSMTDYGGQQISQAEAQEARQYIVDHRDDVVAWGLKNGQFTTETEGHGFVDREARLHELNAADRAEPCPIRSERSGSGWSSSSSPIPPFRRMAWKWWQRAECGRKSLLRRPLPHRLLPTWSRRPGRMTAIRSDRRFRI